MGKDKNTDSEHNTSLSYIYSQEYIHTNKMVLMVSENTETFKDAAGF